MPKYSVIVSVFNKKAFVKSTLQSVLDQTEDDFELLVIDDGSTDGSAEIIKEFKDERLLYFYQSNRGASAARNLGLAEAKAPFIALLDGDDLWHAEFLATINQLLDSFPEAKVLATGYELASPHQCYPARYSLDPSQELPALLPYFASSYQSTLLTSSSTVLHRSVLDQIGYYDESIASGQDTDYWIRLGMQYTVAFDPEIQVRVRQDPQSLSKSNSSFETMIDLDKYKEEEAKRPDLKKFLDLNRYSFALKARIWGDEDAHTRFRESINLTNLNLKQKILLHQPAIVLRALIRFKGWAEKMNCRWSSFQ